MADAAAAAAAADAARQYDCSNQAVADGVHVDHRAVVDVAVLSAGV